MRNPLPLLAGCICFPLLFANAGDWPQWGGPNRDNVQTEKGLLKKWPEGGPRLVWMYKQAGSGYAGFSVAEGKLFTMGTRDGNEVLIALDASTGGEKWVAPIGKVLTNNWGDGPRGTPSVDGKRVYALGGQGSLICAETETGKVLWTKTMQEFGGKTPGWGYTESVLVDGPAVVCTPGGDKGTVIALSKETGATLWQSAEIKDKAQYASLVPASINGEKQYVQLTMESIFGVSKDAGKLAWRSDFPGKTAVIPTPVVKGSLVFVTAGYGVGAKMIEIKPGNEVVEAYSNKTMKNHHGGVVLVGDHIYGYSDGIGWLCMELKSGNQVWAERSRLGKGAIACADGMLYCVDEGNGAVVLAEAAPTSWVEHGRFTIDPQSTIRSPQGRIWTHPVIANARMYLRDQDLVYCYDVKAK